MVTPAGTGDGEPSRLERMIHDLIGGSHTREFDARQIAAALEAGELPVERMARLEAVCRHALALVTLSEHVTRTELRLRLAQLKHEINIVLHFEQ